VRERELIVNGGLGSGLSRLLALLTHPVPALRPRSARPPRPRKLGVRFCLLPDPHSRRNSSKWPAQRAQQCVRAQAITCPPRLSPRSARLGCPRSRRPASTARRRTAGTGVRSLPSPRPSRPPRSGRASSVGASGMGSGLSRLSALPPTPFRPCVLDRRVRLGLGNLVSGFAFCPIPTRAVTLQ